MANVIKLKRGTSTPTTSDIVDGEVAVDTSAQKLYVRDGSSIKEIGSAGGGGATNPGGSDTQVQYNNSGSFGGSSNMTFDGTNLAVTGTVSAASPAVATAGLRKIHAGTTTPGSGLGSVGDLYLKY